MAQEVTPQQYWKLFKDLPPQLKEALSSEETANSLEEICRRYNIFNISYEFVEYVGQVLLGLLPPDELQETLKKELRLKKDKAKKLARETYRMVFYPVKSSLEELYEMEIAPLATEKIEAPASSPKTPSSTPEVTPSEDPYREPVE